MKATTLPDPSLRSIGRTFVNVIGQTTREPVPRSMRALLRSIETKEQLKHERERASRNKVRQLGVERADEPVLSCAWKCGNCGEVTENPQPTFWPVPCPMCGGIYFQAIRNDD
jgi:rubrerythrin